MYADFKEIVIRLAQHPIMHQPIDQLGQGCLESACSLLDDLLDLTLDDKFTQFDYIQLARAYFNLGELHYALGSDKDQIISCYKTACHLLVRGGFDLSMRKWVEVLSLRSTE